MSDEIAAWLRKQAEADCGACEDAENGYLDAIRDDEPIWLCPHGVGAEVRAP